MQGDLATGSTLGPYRIVELIGRGGMATVYKAYQPALDRHVAIKVLPAYFAHDLDFSERFRREARAVARLEHPNILPVYDFGEQDQMSYIVMSLVAGGTLESRMGTPLPLDWSLRVCDQVAQALDYAHTQGVIHRDVKPSNILLGPGDWALLADFGIAKLADASRALTRSGIGVGTPEYLSPEQAQGLPLDGRSDLYSLAMTLFEMLTGRVPFQGDSALVVVFKHVNDPVPSLRTFNSSVPPAIDMIVRRALAKRPEDRFATAGEFIAALQRVGPANRAPEVSSTGEPVAVPTPAEAAPPCAPPVAAPTLSSQPTVVTPGTPPQRQPNARRRLLVGAAATALVLLSSMLLLRNGSPLAVASDSRASTPASSPAATSDDDVLAAMALATETQAASAAATQEALAAESTATAEAATTALVAMVQATAQAEFDAALEATAQARAVAATPTAQITATPLKAVPTAARAPTVLPPTPLPPTLAVAVNPPRDAPRLAARMTVEIAEADCRHVSGAVTVNLPAGRQPVRDYTLKGVLFRPNGTQEVIWDNLAVPGPRFQLEYPVRLPPRGSYEIGIQVTKLGVAQPAMTRQAFTC